MVAGSICRFNRYGYFKFGITCRQQHCNEIYSDDACENPQCYKRHPIECKYFKQFRRCKFGVYCAYLHVPVDNEKVTTKEEMNNFEIRLKQLEDSSMTRDIELAALKLKVYTLQKENEELKLILEILMNVFKKVTEETVKKTTDMIVNTLNKQQDEKEKHTERQFNALNSQILNLVRCMKKPASSPPHLAAAVSYSNQASSFPCNVCGISLNSNKCLENHIKSIHNKPNS